VQKNDKVMSFVTEKVAKVVKSSNAKKKIKDNTKSKQIDYINHLPFPKAVKKALIENNNSDVYTAMAVDNFKDYISNSIARIIVNAAVFTVLMLISIIGLGVLCEILNIISKLPVVNGLNKTAGLFVGLLQGFIIIWIGCIVLTTFSGTKTGQDIFDIINQNQFLSMIYNNNYFLKFITNLGTTLF
jgi:AAA+ ATPase superfamily predicted ATPase